MHPPLLILFQVLSPVTSTDLLYECTKTFISHRGISMIIVHIDLKNEVVFMSAIAKDTVMAQILLTVNSFSIPGGHF